MYNSFNSENDEFSIMQERIKNTIESIVSDNHTHNPSVNSPCDSIADENNKYL